MNGTGRMACARCDKILTSRGYAKDHLTEGHGVDEELAEAAVNEVNWTDE